MPVPAGAGISLVIAEVADRRIRIQRAPAAQGVFALQRRVPVQRAAPLPGLQLRLQRQGRVEWQAEVDARQLAQIRAGAKAEVTLPSGEVRHGTVRLVAPTLSTTWSMACVRAWRSLPSAYSRPEKMW